MLWSLITTHLFVRSETTALTAYKRKQRWNRYFDIFELITVMLDRPATRCTISRCAVGTVFTEWSGMRTCADVLQMITILPPPSRRQSCPRRSMFEVHLRLRGPSVFFFVFLLIIGPLNHLTGNVLRPRLPEGTVHLVALSRIIS